MLPLADYGISAILIQIVIAMAISAIAARLMAKDKFVGPTAADANANIAVRGSYLPLVFGTLRVGCLVGWVGPPVARRVRVADGGREWGLFGKKKGVYSQAFSADGWHLISVGPVDAIEAIYINGKRAHGRIDHGTASGESVMVRNPTPQEGNDREYLGQLYVFWGETDQPLHGPLASAIGVKSRWPNVCHVYWKSFDLGIGGGAWPTVEYVISRFPLVELSDTLGSYSTPVVDADGDPLAAGIAIPGGVTGYNPAYMLQVAGRSTFPHGCGLPAETFDPAEWQALYDDALASKLASHAKVLDGDTYADLVQAVASDDSFFVVAEGMRIRPAVLRDVDSPPVAEAKDLPPSGDETLSVDHSPVAVTNPVWVFADETGFEYAKKDIGIPYDTGSIDNGVVTTRRASIETLTNQVAADVAAGYQRANTVIGTEMRVSVLHQFRALGPGDVFTHPVLGDLRVQGRKWSWETPAVELTCTADNFKAGTVASEPTEASTTSATADRAVYTLFRPVETDPSRLVLLVARAPFSAVEGSAVYRVTVAGGAEIRSGRTTAGAGDSFYMIQSSSPTEFFVANLTPPPVEGYPSVTLPEAYAGKWMLFMGAEIAYLKDSVVTTPSTDWQAEAYYEEGDVVFCPEDSAKALVCISSGVSGTTAPTASTLGTTATDGTTQWVVAYGSTYLSGVLRAQEGTAQEAAPTGTIGAMTLDMQTFDLGILRGDNVCVGTVPYAGAEALTPEPALACKTAYTVIAPGGNTITTGSTGELIVSTVSLNTLYTDQK